MATKDVAVFDGTGWVSISGGDGAAGADGKSVELSPAPPSSATNVPNIDDNTPGVATLTLTLNAGSSDDTKNVYDVAVGVPVGIRGEKGEAGTGVNILGEKPSQGDLPADGNPGDAWLINGDLWVWDDENNTWINVGSIKGPQGDPGKAPTFTPDAPVSFKSCGDYTADATVALDGGTTEQPNYKISMEIPQPVRVYKVADAGDGTPTGITGACTGDFWIVTD
jgi:hypothetical protein